ncbi:hypothetical protein SMI01S_35040 [Sphingobacterium mizutaii NBRC 14946 = DSM 11724]|uniref:Uncharacterized protein n=1 Tax=Sphingobacterium mizutaii NBRC 14946 = DSM 11724 TaxID=1220576 RepID=A0ABQ0W7I6_9SPHI|nr:hypothetical protein SMI01S_35040 [Sphingobacterium mizutaii NBRC 14946 = DSM 11724]
MYPEESLNFEISRAFSFSVPVITGISYVDPFKLIDAVSDIIKFLVLFVFYTFIVFLQMYKIDFYFLMYNTNNYDTKQSF